MSPRLNGKFVSQEKYEAAMSAGKEEVVTEQAEPKTRKPRTVDPVTTATARVRKAKRELDRVTKIHAKRAELPSLDDAQSEYDAAVRELQDLLNV